MMGRRKGGAPIFEHVRRQITQSNKNLPEDCQQVRLSLALSNSRLVMNLDHVVGAGGAAAYRVEVLLACCAR
eukprot:597361-Hanusia_phi.AAC.2